MNSLFDAALKSPQLGGSQDFWSEHSSGFQYVVTVRGVPDFESPIWHVSVFLNGLPVKEWRQEDVWEGSCLLKSLCKEILSQKEIIKIGDKGLHIRRALSKEELAKLDPKWVAKFERWKAWNAKSFANALQRMR